MSERTPLTTPTFSTRSMLLTVYGAFVRRLGGWVAVRDLVRLFKDLDVDSGALRAALSRLKKGGTLESRRVAGVQGYLLSDSSDAFVAEGEQRLLGRLQHPRLDDGWVLAVFSVPEDRREVRALITRRLEWLGYGQMSAGIRIAPANQLDLTRQTLTRLGVSRYVHLLTAQYQAFDDLRGLAGTWWDLDGINQGYRTFIQHTGPLLDKWDPGHDNDQEAFVDYVRLRTLWRRLPYLDPGLPPELYPDPQPRTVATRSFAALCVRML